MARRFSSRELYRLLLVGGLFALAGGWYAFAARPSNGEAGRYIEGVVGRPAHPSPLFAGDSEPDTTLASLLFSGLTRIGPDGAPLPDLAASWEVTPDLLSYTFHLRADLSWDDGQALDARDVMFTVGAVQAAGFEGSPTLAVRWAGISTEAPDERTIIFHLPAPSPAFLTLASLGIVPQHLLEGLEPSELRSAPVTRSTVGSGPFRLVHLDAAAATLEPNPTYHLGTPQLQRIEVRFYPNPTALAGALRARDIDAALLDEIPSPTTLGAVASRPDLHATPLVEGAYTILYMNNQRDPLADPALRRALTASIDRPKLIEGDDPALPGDGPIVPGSWAYSAGAWPTPAQAEGLWIAAGWSRGSDGVLQRQGQRLHLDLWTNDDPVRAALAGAIGQQLQDQGATVTTHVLPSDQLLREHVETRDFDLLLFGWQTDIDPDPYGGWHTSQIAAGGRNVAGYHDAGADQLLERARGTVNIAARRDFYVQWQARFVELAPSLIVEYPRRLYVQPSNLIGPAGGVLFDSADRFFDVYLWHFVRAR